MPNTDCIEDQAIKIYGVIPQNERDEDNWKSKIESKLGVESIHVSAM